MSKIVTGVVKHESGGTIAHLGGLCLDVPPNAFPEDATIEIADVSTSPWSGNEPATAGHAFRIRCTVPSTIEVNLSLRIPTGDLPRPRTDVPLFFIEIR